MRHSTAILFWLILSAFGGVVPVEPVAVPSEASANGFTTLAANQDAFTNFDLSPDGTGSHMWFNGFWQGASVGAQYITWNNGGYIDLDWNSSMAIGCTQAGGCPIPQISTGNAPLTNYRGFGHGYYECRAAIKSLTPGGWAACWLLGLTTGQDCVAGGYNGWNTISPGAPYSEIDNEQIYGSSGSGVTIDALYNALHEATADTTCGGDDTIVPPVCPSGPPCRPASTSGADLTQIHKYGTLWCGANSSGSVCNGTPQVCWYFDDVQTYCQNTTVETENQLVTIQAWMAENCTTINDGSCLGGVTDIHNQVYSVRYWSCAAWQGNALAC